LQRAIDANQRGEKTGMGARNERRTNRVTAISVVAKQRLTPKTGKKKTTKKKNSRTETMRLPIRNWKVVWPLETKGG